MEHRHIYLFEYDVMSLALGDWGANICRQYEERPSGDEYGPHQRAWEWAMTLSFEQRQAALAWLTAKKVTREHWADKPVKRVSIADWETKLEKMATRATAQAKLA